MAERAVLEQTAQAWAVVDDDGTGASTVNECDEANAATGITIRCMTIE
jgi:hypothetical protein